MRTKALILAAAIGAVGLATSMAQVYSVNIVGYVNTSVPRGFSIIANPLNASPGNAINNVIPTPTSALSIYKWRPASGDFDQSNYDPDFQEWDNIIDINPGDGFFIYNPGATVTITFVGEVPLGTLTTSLTRGFNMLSSKVPQSGRLQTDLLYPPSAGGDTVYKFNNAAGVYDIYNYDPDFQAWDPEEPSLGVGEGCFVFRTATTGSWTRVFNVN